MNEALSNDVSVTLLVSLVSLVAVWIPFYRGGKIGLQALAATRKVDPAEIERGLRHHGPERASVTLQMLQVLRSSLRDNQGNPVEFVIDATRQYVSNDYDAHYQRPISMFANILPPIGFIGTTGGLLILFLSMRVASDSLELGALALALTSSIFALISFALLEGLKIRLYHRMLARIDDALAFYRASAARAASQRASNAA